MMFAMKKIFMSKKSNTVNITSCTLNSERFHLDFISRHKHFIKCFREINCF